MMEEAVLLSIGGSSGEFGNMVKLLDFFGAPWRILTIQDWLSSNSSENTGQCRIFCSADTLLVLFASNDLGSEFIRHWQRRVHSAFVYKGNSSVPLRDLIRSLSGNRSAVVEEIDRYKDDFIVSGQMQTFCGVMTGVRIGAGRHNIDIVAVPETQNANVASIISSNHGATFLRLERESVPVFLSTSEKVIDTEAILPTGVFDIRDCVPSALPVVLYVKWAFPGIIWSTSRPGACVVIDDPLLKPRYGFIDYRVLLTLMKRHRFAVNVAFIPWNCQRSARQTARLFKENPDCFSLSIHGCDHTRAEFGCSDRRWLNWKTQQAVARMAVHESKTEVHYDRIMVFPQGVFSNAAIGVLKSSGLIAAVNNDTLSIDRDPHSFTVCEWWEVAVMGYESFPIYTRRYPWDGIENFAFDLLLGKPCIVAIHHDFCSSSYERLLEFVEQLNALKCTLTWRGLGDIVRQSYRQRRARPGVDEVEMYGTEICINSTSSEAEMIKVRRRESSPTMIQDIQANSKSLNWSAYDGYVHFRLETEDGQGITVRVMYYTDGPIEPCHESLLSRIKTATRRYLSEGRDNFIIKYRLPLVSRFTRIN